MFTNRTEFKWRHKMDYVCPCYISDIAKCKTFLQTFADRKPLSKSAMTFA
jgi:hypothetical protein